MITALASLLLASAQPGWWSALDEDERAAAIAVGEVLDLSPYEVLNSDGSGFSEVAVARVAADPSLMTALQRIVSEGPDERPAEVAPPPAPAGAADAAPIDTSDDALRAAAAAIPARRRPEAVFQNYSFQTTAFGVTSDIWAEYLFPNGALHACDGYDPGLHEPTPEGAAAYDPDCEVEQARVQGERYAYRDGGAWETADDATVIRDGASRPGQRFDLAYGRGSGITAGTGDTSVVRLDQDSLRMTPDGRIFSGRRVQVDAPGAMQAGSVVVVGNQRTVRTETLLQGRYYADGHVLTVALDEGGTVHRLFTLSRDGAGEIDGVFLDGYYFWDADE